MPEMLRPNDLKEISSNAEMAKMQEEREAKKKKDEQLAKIREAFMAREIHPEVFDRINKAIRIAAERGQHQLEVLTFPCKFCNDGGRSINNYDPDWPKSLEGFAKKAYQFFDKELRPLGFKLQAEIISFPDGMPGDVGIYLKW
jgi:hypothetical protein